MSRPQPPADDSVENGQVFEEEDHDLDLNLDDLGEANEESLEQRLTRRADSARKTSSLAERMREAAQRGRTRSVPRKDTEKGKHTDEGHEIVEEEDDDIGDINLDDESPVEGENAQSQIVEEEDETGDLDLSDVASATPEVGEVATGWDDTEAMNRAKLEQMQAEAGPATIAEMKLDEAGVAPTPNMQAGPMTMAVYEAELGLSTVGPISDTDTGGGSDEQLGTGATPSHHVENRSHNVAEDAGFEPGVVDAGAEAISQEQEEARPQTFNSELPAGGATITYKRDETGQVVRTESGRLKAVAPDKTISFSRDETGQVVRNDVLLRRLAREEDPALREVAERKLAEEQEREARQKEAAERLAEEQRQRQEQEELARREREEEERELAERARQAARAKAEEQELAAKAREAMAASRKRQDSSEQARQARLDAKRRAEAEEQKRREEQDARETYEEEMRRQKAAQEEIRVANEHASEFEREMSERRHKQELKKREAEKKKRAIDEEIARLEAEAKKRRAMEAETAKAWEQHAQAKGQGKNKPPVEGSQPQGTVSGGRAEPPHTRERKSEDSHVADDSGAPLGRGLDVGTANLVAARMDAEGGIEFFPARNAFLDVPEDPYTLKMLKSQGVPYIKRENKLYVIGQDAFELANIFNREMRRPMKNGLISPTDADAMPMEVELFKKILGPPRVDMENCYYSIPADPVDSTMNIVYHTNIANGLLQRLGYKGTPFNEGLAIVFSELGDDEFTGIGISCGGGMVNVCVAFRSMNVISFSSAKGGDWIDQQAAQVMGCAASRITHIKESGVDINAPKSPEEEAIVIYYRHQIKYSLENIVKKFAITKDIPNFPKPVPIAVSGGTSMIGGFIEVFKDEFSKMSKNFPIKISDIRRAEDQFNATAKGCLLGALSNEE